MKEKSGHKISNSNKNNIKIVIHNETKKKKRKRSKKKDKQDLHHAQIGNPVQPQGQAVVTADGTVVNVKKGTTLGGQVDNLRQLALDYLAPPPVAPQLQIANAPAVVVNPLNRQALPPPAPAHHQRAASPARSPMRVAPKQKQKKQQVHQLNKIGLMKVKTLKELRAVSFYSADSRWEVAFSGTIRLHRFTLHSLSLASKQCSSIHCFEQFFSIPIFVNHGLISCKRLPHLNSFCGHGNNCCDS